MGRDTDRRTIFILSASSDIGHALIERYLAAGCRIVGTYRQPASLAAYLDHPDVLLLPLELADPHQASAVAEEMKRRGLQWDLFVAANATMEPIGRFLEIGGEEWVRSIEVNALMPCLVLKQLYPLRRPGRVNDVAFFAGGGTNNPFRNYSAYCLSKILLIKMCELLDDEAEDLNTFIIGPGYVKTKIHEETLRAGSRAEENYQKTVKFFETSGSSMDDIFRCIEWCVRQGRAVVGGRNISLVHDAWRNGGEALAERLRGDRDFFKLRRHSTP
jgi:NAD(P)-dependent dehydrogenase (short-subunit alcohol dehydrogenase family)